MNIQKKVQKYLDLFEVKTRDNGTTYCVVPLPYDPKYNKKLSNAIRQAHGDRFPDDYIYSTFMSCLEKITEYDSIETIEDLQEISYEMVDSMVDIYTADLLKWLSDDIRNVYYITEVLEEYETKDGFQLLSQAQYKYIEEIMQEVINLLSK